MNTSIASPTTYKNFSLKGLGEFFDLVKNKEHWKNPIQSYCTSEEIKGVSAAIEFYTATHPSFDYLCEVEHGKENGRFKVGDHIFLVRAEGYRKGPAGDH